MIFQNFNYEEIKKLNLRWNKSLNYYKYLKSDFYQNCKFSLAIEDNIVIGYYSKTIGTESYGYGYIESSKRGVGNHLLSKMKEFGSYISFVRICNIPSVKMHFKAFPNEILKISEEENFKSKYYNDIINKKIGYKSEVGYCPIVDNNLSEFITTSKKIELIHNDKPINTIDDGKDTSGIANVKLFLLYSS